MDLKTRKKYFDIKRYLNDRNVRFWNEGDNISFGWIGLSCIYCDDHMNHLGINLENNSFKCWICHEEGDVITLIKDLEGVSFIVAKNRLDDYQRGEKLKLEKPQRTRRTKGILPEGYMEIEKGDEPEVVKRYIERRRFDLSICQDYDLGFIEHSEMYNLRLIVPIYLDNDLVSYQAIDVTGKASIPYLDCPEDVATVYNKHLVYGIDDQDEGQIIIVEGVTDKWRIGKHGRALFGKNYTKEQLNLIKRKTSKDVKVKVLFDPDASQDGWTFANELGLFFPRVLFIDLGGTSDPADLNDNQIWEIVNGI